MCDIKLFKSSKAKAKPVRGSRRLKVFIEIVGKTLIQIIKSDRFLHFRDKDRFRAILYVHNEVCVQALVFGFAMNYTWFGVLYLLCISQVSSCVHHHILTATGMYRNQHTYL